MDETISTAREGKQYTILYSRILSIACYTVLLYQQMTNKYAHLDKVIDFHISSICACVNSLRRTSLHAGTSPIAIL